MAGLVLPQATLPEKDSAGTSLDIFRANQERTFTRVGFIHPSRSRR